MNNGMEREQAKGQRSDCQPGLQGILSAEETPVSAFDQAPADRSGLGKRTPEACRIRSTQAESYYPGVGLLSVTSVLLP